MDEINYTTSQAARILKVTDRYIRKLIDAGELESVQTEGGRHRIPQRAVHALREARVAEARATVAEQTPTASTETLEAAQEAAELRLRVSRLFRGNSDA